MRMLYIKFEMKIKSTDSGSVLKFLIVLFTCLLGQGHGFPPRDVPGAAPTSQGQETQSENNKAGVETLILTQVIFRHGDRTPLVKYPKDPNGAFEYGGVKGSGQLTRKGKGQAYQLGRFLRDRYNGFLSSTYSPDEIFVQSSDIDRTIMTGQGCLAGLFPPNLQDPPSQWWNASSSPSDLGSSHPGLTDWQPIPIHVLAASVDTKIATEWTVDKCRKYKELYVQNALDPIRGDKETTLELYKYLSTHSGLKVTNFEPVYLLADIFHIQKLYGLDLPPWTQGYYPEQMKSFYDFEFKAYTLTDQMKRLFMGQLLFELTKNMDLAMTNNNNGNDSSSDPSPPPGPNSPSQLKSYHRAKAYLYSGHDTTISSLLNTLDMFDGEGPPYTSALMIELHKNSQDEGQDREEPMVKIFYNKHPGTQGGRTDHLEIPNCGHQCPLSKFKQLYGKFILNEDQLVDECSQGTTGSGNGESCPCTSISRSH